ncbi:hypothetical protein GGR51DRAFT_546978 [Nemania sp. FL0031]|nr:hypothetical protein GGR51DRAFT_546978 [Nemania sp. FL0031]
MDPLSLSASIIAVLQATNAVISFCYNYRAAAKSASWELPRVIEQVKSLRNVLETLEGLTSDTKGTDPDAVSRLQTLQQLCKPKTGNEGGLLAMCLEELHSLQKKLAPPGWAGPVGSKRMALVQALKWPLKESDTKKTLDNIGRYRDTLSLALMTDQTIDEHREKVHEWLAAPDPSSNHVDALGKRRATTGSWFIGSTKFDDWKNDPNSFLWLSGIPGCGKTVLTSVIIEAVLEHCRLSVGTAPNPPPTCAVVFFYFDFSQGQKRNHERMIRSLIRQLSQQLQYTSEPLESLFSTCTNGNRQPSIEALQNCLRQMIEEFNQVFLILDALDECEEREDLIDSINEITGWGLQTLHILTTSRMEGDIIDGLNVTEEQKLHIQSDLIEEDIRAYIYARLQMDKKLRRWRKDKKDQEAIVGTLMEKSDGMFRWAACQLDALKKCLSRRELQNALASLPKTLDETYDKILCSIEEERCEIVLRILQWLAYSARPLQIEEVADVIAVDTKSKPRFDPESRFPEPRDILTICSSLVSASSNATGGSYNEKVGEQIRLAHLSVRDYLVSERILTGKAARYSLQESRAHESISQICLAYLLQFDKPGSLPRENGGSFPLARYAAEYWPQHVRASGKETDGIVLLSMELFSNQDVFANWIRLFDPDKASPVPVTGNGLEGVASPLYYASLAGLNEPIKLLLEQGADVNEIGGVYGSALQAASARGFDDTVKLLLDNGAEVDAQGGIFGSALQAASVGGHSKVVQLLLRTGADVNGRGGLYEDALQAASAEGHGEVVLQLIKAGADISALGGVYGSALHAASYGGHGLIVEHLLDAGADIELQDRRGRTPLYQASSEGHATTIRLLLSRGANVNAEDQDGWAALDEAGPAGHVETVQALLDAGADVNAPDIG